MRSDGVDGALWASEEEFLVFSFLFRVSGSGFWVLNMATFRKFEEIKAWEKARQLTVAVYAVTKQGEFSRDFGLRDQIQRAVVSIGSNIAEGFERNGNKEFVKFLYYAKGSAGEVQSQLYAAKDLGYIDDIRFRELYDAARLIADMIGALIKSMKESGYQGPRYLKSTTRNPQPETRNS